MEKWENLLRSIENFKLTYISIVMTHWSWSWSWSWVDISVCVNLIYLRIYFLKIRNVWISLFWQIWEFPLCLILLQFQKLLIMLILMATDRLTYRQTDWLIYWRTDWQTVWVTDWLTDWLTEILTEIIYAFTRIIWIHYSNAEKWLCDLFRRCAKFCVGEDRDPGSVTYHGFQYFCYKLPKVF